MNQTSRSQIFSQCRTAGEMKRKLQTLSRWLISDVGVDSYDKDDIAPATLAKLSFSNLKAHDHPVFLLSEVCRLLMLLGDRASLRLCLELSHKIYPFHCRNNESMIISHLYRGIAQIGLKMSDIGIKNVSFGLAAHAAFSMIPEDRALGFWALTSAAVWKRNLDLARTFAEKW